MVALNPHCKLEIFEVPTLWFWGCHASCPRSPTQPSTSSQPAPAWFPQGSQASQTLPALRYWQWPTSCFFSGSDPYGLCIQKFLGLWKTLGKGYDLPILLSNEFWSLSSPTHYEDPCQSLLLPTSFAVKHDFHHPSSKPSGLILGPEDAWVSTRLAFKNTILVHATGNIYVSIL